MAERERVWDKYLSERDKWLEEQSFFNKTPVNFGVKPALLLIDNCVGGLGDTPMPLQESLKHYPLSCGLEGWAAVAQQKRLLDLCRELDMLIIHTNIEIAPNSPLLFYQAVRSHAQRTMKPKSNAPLQYKSDTAFDFTPDLAPIDEEVVILKSGASAFSGTPLAGVLSRFRIDTLLVCGESTSGCVRATVVDASMLCLHTIVVEECVYDRTEASHAINLYDMDQKYAAVKSIEEVMDWLNSGAAETG
jgi:nicotinamidase-related amidase